MIVSHAAAGRPYTLAVRDAVLSAKAGEPLEPVTVVVPSNLAGLSLRRLLGSNLLDPAAQLGPAGIANVSFATPFQFASTIAAHRLAADGVRPLTTAVLAAAVRHVLRVTPGRFDEVAEHTATETALVRAYGELTTLTADHRRELARHGSDRAAAVVALVDDVAKHVRGSATTAAYHDESAVFAAAIDALTSDDVHDGITSVVLAGPYEQGAAALEFLTAAAESHNGTALVALTGDPTVDDAAVTQMATISGSPSGGPAAKVPVPTRMVPAADADEEVRSVVRAVVALAEAGECFDRMAVFYPSQNPYARTLREQFDASEIPTAGPDHRRLADSMTGRLLGRLLALGSGDDRDESFSREGVLGLVAAAPVRGPDGRPVRPGPWENISRRAGVIGGLHDWNEKLARHESNLESRGSGHRTVEQNAGFIEALARERQATTALSEFVEWIHQLTAPVVVGTSWQKRSEWALKLLADLLPPSNRRNSWPEPEIDAAERIEVVLRRVGVLDQLEPDAPYSAFVRAIELELDAPIGSRGRFGTGVLLAPLASSAGLDLDHVFVVGLSEGVCPRPLREDTLLPDADRLVLGSGLLPAREDRLRDQRRRFLTALASGAVSRTLVMPLGDHRNGKVRTASRWWIEALRNLGADETITSKSWPTVDLAQLAPGVSFTQATAHAAMSGTVLSIADFHLHHALTTGAPHPDDAIAIRSATMEREAGSGFSRFGGDLGTEDLPHVAGADRPISPTRLETWASCPRRYFFAQVLGLGVIEPPDRISEISALDRGSLWHSILEDFLAEALPGEPHAPPSPDWRWTPADRERLHAHAARRFAEFEAAGVTGRPLLWAIDQESLLADLDRFLEADNDLRAHFGSTPVAVEFAIGMGPDSSARAAVVELPDGRSLELRGYADRVDTRADGSPVVIDYKTGKNETRKKKFRALLRDDPVHEGTKLQLGVYAEAARQHYRTERSSAWYWFTSEKGAFDRAGYEWTSHHRQTFGATLQTIVSGIEGGLFPPNPGDFNSFFGSYENCSFCDFTTICPQRRDEEFVDAIADDRLADFVTMKDPDPFDLDSQVDQ